MTIAKLKAILTSVVTYITIVQAALLIFAEELADLFVDGQAKDVIAVIVMVIAVLGAIVNIIRRVTPVLPDQRGLVLPQGASSVVHVKKHYPPAPPVT